jgi:hypothetical protein
MSVIALTASVIKVFMNSPFVYGNQSPAERSATWFSRFALDFSRFGCSPNPASWISLGSTSPNSLA